MAMAMGREKTAAVLPEPWPDAFAIRLRKLQLVHRRTRKKLEAPFAMIRRQRFESWQDLEQEHQPMRLALIPVFADDASQVQIARPKSQGNFLLRFAASARVR